jgi:chromate transporter
VSRPRSRDVVRFFVRLGSTGFGGPIALVGYLEREFVERRGWVSREEFSDGLALSQLAPGPLAAQLAIYLGWTCGGVRGATLGGLAFIAPSFLMVLAISAAYVRFGGLPWLQAMFYGIGAAVIAIIARSAIKLVRTAVAGDRLLWLPCIISAVVTAWVETEVVWVFVASGLAVLLVRTRPGLRIGDVHSFVVPPALFVAVVEPHAAGALWTIAAFFASASLLVFGSGLAIVPFLHAGVVERFGWLTERQFLDAVAVSMITPGPVVITVAFIGYLAAGPLGATVAAIGMFAPVYVITVVLAPFYRRFKSNRQVHAFVSGVTAAAVGAIAGAALVLGRRAITDAPTAAIGSLTAVILFSLKRVPEPVVILGAGVVGLVVRAIMGSR